MKRGAPPLIRRSPWRESSISSDTSSAEDSRDDGELGIETSSEKSPKGKSLKDGMGRSMGDVFEISKVLY